MRAGADACLRLELGNPKCPIQAGWRGSGAGEGGGALIPTYEANSAPRNLAAPMCNSPTVTTEPRPAEPSSPQPSPGGGAQRVATPGSGNSARRSKLCEAADRSRGFNKRAAPTRRGRGPRGAYYMPRWWAGAFLLR